MIRLTRLRNDNVLYLNPDHIERLDHHHDTIVHLFNGTEYVVSQTPEEIVELVVNQRARILAVAARLAEHVDESQTSDDAGDDTADGSADRVSGNVSGNVSGIAAGER